MKLFIFSLFRKLTGRGWQIGWTAGEDGSLPKIEYHCPFCRNTPGATPETFVEADKKDPKYRPPEVRTQAWVAAGPNGFNGIAPVARCCAAALPYPVDDNDYLEHLSAKPKHPVDAGRPVMVQRSESDGEYEYEQYVPRGF